MPSFGRDSKRILATCHPKIQIILHEVIKHFDCTVIRGHRGKAAQNEAFRTGASKKPWPTSLHIAGIVERGYRVLITHGNGPQVGFILLRSELAKEVLHQVPKPFDAGRLPAAAQPPR